MWQPAARRNRGAPPVYGLSSPDPTTTPRYSACVQPGSESPEPAPQAGSEPSAPLAEGGPRSSRLTTGMRTRASDWATASPYRLPLAVAAVGLVVSAPFGGWRTAEPEGLPTVAPGEVIEAAPFEVTLERAYYSPRPSDSFSDLDEDQLYVVVLGTVTSRHEASVTGTMFSRAVEVTDLPDPVDPLSLTPVEEGEPVLGELYSAQDSTGLRLLGPDLTYDIGLVLVTDADDLPDELTVEVSAHDWRRDAFSGEEGWHDPDGVARVSVPLTEQEAPSGDGSTAGPDASGGGR